MPYLRMSSMSEPPEGDEEGTDGSASEKSDDTTKSLEDNLTLETGPLSNVR